jgi:protoporphyrinogen oxidase
MKKVAVIGGGLSGLSIAKCLTDRYDVKVFEKESRPGGLIKCDRVNGNLYHIVGGHVFNSKRTDVLDWFWGFFNREAEFTKATRNAIISMGDGLKVGYPIENNIYQFSNDIITSFIQDVVSLAKDNTPEPLNFEEFLRYRFGDTLYNLYFKPYNEKVWRKDLKSVPLSWLEGKLPMPTINEMIFNNITHAQETKMVHSSFYYAKQNGSQFLVDRLAQGLNIVYNSEIVEISKQPVGWRVNNEEFDKVIFCGNIKHLPAAINNID